MRKSNNDRFEIEVKTLERSLGESSFKSSSSQYCPLRIKADERQRICYHFLMVTKIVIDTNVLISALIGSTGPSKELIRRCLKSEYQPLIGNALFSDYESIIEREEILAKCPLTKTEILTLLASLMSVSKWVSIYYLWRPNLRDEADNHLIELAVAGNAKIIATNNVRDFQNAKLLFPNLSILKPEEIIRS